MRLFKALRAHARAFGEDTRASMAVLFALSLGIMIFAAGAAVDLTRVALARQVLQQATDSAAVSAVRIAVAGASDLTAKESFEPQVGAYVAANLAAANSQNLALTTEPQIDLTLTATSVTVEASVTMAAGLTRVFGIKTLPVAASSTVKLPPAGADPSDIQITG